MSEHESCPRCCRKHRGPGWYCERCAAEYPEESARLGGGLDQDGPAADAVLGVECQWCKSPVPSTTSKGTTRQHCGQSCRAKHSNWQRKRDGKVVGHRDADIIIGTGRTKRRKA